MDEPMVYTVGWISHLRGLIRLALHLHEVPQGQRRGALVWAAGKFRHEARYCWRQGRVGNWQAVRNAVVGWRAEDPLSLACGSALTKRRAVRDLKRKLAVLDLDGGKS